MDQSNGIVVLLLELAFAVVTVAGMWKVFEKAGKPGWASLVPIYNFIVMLEIVEKPMWWIALMFIPFVNFVIAIMLLASLAAKFGKSGGFVVGMIFLPFIFYPLLGFGDAKFQGNSAQT